ncbi:ferrous iron transport protein A [Candidatus Bipolaricaulota bacterium]|nr:ferrous iron transport protein A [Candidatus Bipolaricaulota bacterium]
MNINSGAIPLSQLPPGEAGQVYAVLGPGRGVQLRLLSLGLRPGATVRVLGRGPGHGPLLVEVNGTRVALGRGVAHRVLVIPSQKKG